MANINIKVAARVAATFGGAWLAYRAFRNRSANSWMGAAVGSQLLQYGITGRCQFYDGRSLASKKTDIVDVASEQSFPASDPPSWNVGTV